ncbi:MAG TPA: hypothetical protein VFB04_10285 [Terriglobales bacterium]|nr:hypothetical protein [Terriglobales bacterium]
MMKLFSSSRFLAIYSGVLTIVFAATVLAGFAGSQHKQKFGEIEVERINVVEPDGTLRLMISNKASFPGIIIKGKETPHPTRKSAGMLFFNDEGTENGGLIFGGSKDAQGAVTSYGHLSFDQYEQDQLFSIDTDQEGGNRTSEVRMIDQPDHPITDDLQAAARIARLPKDQQAAALQQYRAGTSHSQTRIMLGRGADRSVALRLKDIQGRDRIVIRVQPGGDPVLQLLDEQGKITAQLPSPRSQP